MGASAETIAMPNNEVRRRGLTRRRGLLFLFLALLLVSVGQAEYRPSPLEAAMAPHRFSIVAWELERIFDKPFRILTSWATGSPELNGEARAVLVREFFDLGLAERRMTISLRQAELEGQLRSGGDTLSAPLPEADQLADAIAENRARRADLLPQVESIVEEAVAEAARAQGMDIPWLGIFPPVDTTFGSPPNVLVLSPRDRIYRQDAFLLRSGMEDATRDELEAVALATENLSAVVAPTGGLSVYPSVVVDTSGMYYGLEVAAHEWVHHWLYFRPLGRNYGKSSQMLTLNETAATIAGEELGQLAYTAITGEEFTPRPTRSNPDGFDFIAEMRETRAHAEELLNRGDVAGAEEYMERRRKLFVSRGYNIRKINQAYFAFHGSYATRGGSISPIGEQMRELRRRSDSLGDFLRTVGQFGSYQEYVEFWEGLDGVAQGVGP